MITKRCNTCGNDKELDCFHNSSRSKDGKQGACIECRKDYRERQPEKTKEKHRQYSVNWRVNNPQRSAFVDFKNSIRIYNLLPEQYYVLLADQNYGCAICGKSPEENGTRLAVDHDHACCPGDRSCGNCVRALLCRDCNRGLGCFKDSNNFLNAAAGYISKFKETPRNVTSILSAF
jgi:hypothetical protein